MTISRPIIRFKAVSAVILLAVAAWLTFGGGTQQASGWCSTNYPGAIAVSCTHFADDQCSFAGQVCADYTCEMCPGNQGPACCQTQCEFPENACGILGYLTMCGGVGVCP